MKKLLRRRGRVRTTASPEQPCYVGLEPRLLQPVGVPSLAKLVVVEVRGLFHPPAVPAGGGWVPGQPCQPEQHHRRQRQQPPWYQRLYECGGSEEAPW